MQLRKDEQKRWKSCNLPLCMDIESIMLSNITQEEGMDDLSHILHIKIHGTRATKGPKSQSEELILPDILRLEWENIWDICGESFVVFNVCLILY